ncbi:hypothetical protein MXD63_01355 [Frankia sp. Cpl3]|nr:hypothetical protein [Frankia sp. Cpl3]
MADPGRMSDLGSGPATEPGTAPDGLAGPREPVDAPADKPADAPVDAPVDAPRLPGTADPGAAAAAEPGERPLAVIDVDGVVADVRHRLRFLRVHPGDWDAFFAAADIDPPLAEGVELVRTLARDHDVIWLTGRPERSRPATVRWLREQGLPVGEVRMRPDDDRQPARIFKRSELRRMGARRRVAVVVDDDPAVVELLRADGWPVLRADWLAYEPTLGNAQNEEGRT